MLVPLLAESSRSSGGLGLRVAATRALGLTGEGDAVTPLLSLLDDEDLAEVAVAGLAHIGAGSEARRALLERLFVAKGDERPREPAVRALARLGAPAGRFIELLRDPDPAMREAAAQALAGFDELPTTAIEPLAHALSDVRTSRSAATALSHLPTLPPSVVAALVDNICFQGDDGAVRCVGLLDGEAKRMFGERLHSLLAGKRPIHPATLARILSEQGLSPDNAIDLLRAGLASPRCVDAIRALGAMGRHAMGVLSELKRLTRSHDPLVRQAARCAMCAVREDAR
jgi:HEAT repeat protein